MKVALSIAGSDPTGGAGLQLDVQVFRHFGVHGAGVPTALTVQDGAGVKQVLPCFPNVVLEQLRVLLADLQPAAVKLGMLATDDVARSVALALDRLGDDVPVVLDPVLRSSNGVELLERRAYGTLASLFPRATLVTPNRPEALELTGEDTASDAGCERAAEQLGLKQEARAVLLKGGHRDGAPRDLLTVRDGDGVRHTWLEGERVEPADGDDVHGTGCALSSAIAANLALGQPLEDAIACARSFIQGAIAASRRPDGSDEGAALLAFPPAS